MKTKIKKANKKYLDSINSNETVRIKNINTAGKLKQKLLDMGFIAGSEITIVREAPLYDPMELKLHNYNISLRKSEASLIEVTKI
ncbi:MAG: ferrous iron transport protein A [Campylobacterota bacterium]|nr:ferrous iron transport protein A [Campylobacterota bacterium]